MTRGLGERCYGFISSDGQYVHCTRKEIAGGLRLLETSQTYAHRLRERCKCGERHNGKPPKKRLAVYQYRDKKGKLLYETVRTEPKSFLQRRPDGKGGWIWNLDGVELVLYRLPELLAAELTKTVYVVEGEKCADALAALGFVTTTNPLGAGSWREEYSEQLRGHNVAILPDNDDTGRTHVDTATRSLLAKATSIKVVALPGPPPKGDVVDWLESGGTAEQLKVLTANTPEFIAPPIAEDTQRPTASLPFMTAAELAASTPEHIEWVVRPWIASGAVTMVIGKVKAAGKTTLLTLMARAAIKGEPFMGELTKKTRVVYLCEQPTVSFKQALKRAGLLKSNQITILFRKDVIGRSWPEVVKETIDQCKRLGAFLLIVDTLSPFAGLSGTSENEAGRALEVLEPLQEATAAGIGVAIAQHERKAGGDVEESGRGSTAFAGYVDVLLSLSRPKGHARSNLRVLKALSRFDETPEELVIELTEDGYIQRGAVRGIAEEDAHAAIVAAVPKVRSEAMTMEQLVAATHISRTTAQRATEQLVDMSDLRVTGKGTRGDPKRYWGENSDDEGDEQKDVDETPQD
jgi:AAA domain